MSLATEIKTLSASAQAELNVIIGKGGSVITKAETIEHSAVAYLKGNWQELVCVLALGIVIGVLI